MLVALVLLAAGILLLVAGAEAMVRGAARLAVSLGLSTLFVGLTIVAFATSAPELVVSIQSSLKGVPDLAVGNVVGSNICNIAVILGITAVIAPIPCHSTIIRREVPLVIAVTALLWVLGFGGLSRIESGVLVAGLFFYLIWAYRSARQSKEEISLDEIGETTERPSSRFRNVLLIVLGLGGLVLGSELLVRGAVTIAERVGLSEAVIGLTVVAVGTSLPEIATSAVAARRGEPDLAVGNVMGSNLWNVLAVAGITGLIQGLPVDEKVLQFDLPVALFLAVACVPIMGTAARISRGEGVLLCVLYVVYVVVRLTLLR